MVLGLSIIVGLVVVSAATGLAGALISNDSFSGGKKDLVEHTPDSDVSGDGWSVELGEWEVKSGGVREKTDVDVEESSDYRALLDAQVQDVIAVVTLKLEEDEGDQFWGTVVRYTGEKDWIMLFHDGEEDLVLGKKRPDEDLIGNFVGFGSPSAGGFQELGRFEVDWDDDETHTLGLQVVGSAITAFGDEVEVMSAVDDDSMNSTMVGMFSRGEGDNKILDFAVNAAP